MTTTPIHVPRIRVESAQRARVTRWGHAGGFVYRAGDSLVVAEPEAGALLLLVPRGYGNPMLGRQTRSGLVAEPGGVPASTSRWQVLGRVAAVERDLERAVVGSGRWSVEVVLRPLPHATVGAVRAAEERFQGGELSGPELDALCLRAALAEDDFDVQVSIGAAATRARAAELAASAAAGSLRVEVEPTSAQPEATGSVIVGPWPAVPPQAPSVAAPDARMQLSLFGDSRKRHAN